MTDMCQAPSQVKRIPQAVKVLVAAVGVQFFSGTLYIWSIIKDQLIMIYGWTDAQATLPYTLATLIFAFSMFFAGLLQDRTGPRLMTSIGAAMLGLGLILTGLAKSVATMVLAYSLVMGAGIGINNVATTPAVLKWYPPSKKGAITGLVVAAIAVAPVVYSPLLTLLLMHFGMAGGLGILGAGVLVASVALAQWMADPPVGFQPQGSEAQDPSSRLVEGPDMPWQAMVRTSRFYKLFAMFAFSASAGLMLFGHLTRIARLQADWEGGYLLIMLIALFNGLGRFGGGALSDVIGRVKLMRLAFLLQAVNMALFGFLDKPLTLALGVALGGLCYGALFSAFPAITADYYGLEHLGANYGMIFMAWGLGGVLGPQMAGCIFDATGSYRWAFLVALALLLLAFLLSLTLRGKDKRAMEKN
jgi:OFA family oxalate/formate antiporter-like MFS transporter